MVTILSPMVIRHHHCNDCAKAREHNNGLSQHVVEFEYYNSKTNEVHYMTACLHHDCDKRIQKDKKMVIIPYHFSRYHIPVDDWNAMMEFTDDGIKD